MNNEIKKGNLNYDQSGRAYPDNPEIKENWNCIWENDSKRYKLVGDNEHKEWEEIENQYNVMEITSTFEKRVYNIEDGIDKYEVTRIVKHPRPEYDDSYFYSIYREHEIPEASGYWYFEPSDELIVRIKKTIESYEHT